jgi:two-component system cell cycle response regulator DivK
MTAQALILLVEDNVHNRRIFQGVLAHAGFRVVEAEDGERALELAREARPDLILMDLSIPIVDGWECTRRLKADAATRAVPIIALTAHAMRGDEDRAREAGCDGYLSKPISPRRVVDEVRRVLKLPAAPERR